MEDKNPIIFITKQVFNNVEHEEEWAVREYFEKVHNISLEEIEIFANNVNNFKLKHWRKVVSPSGVQYFFKEDLVISVSNPTSFGVVITEHWKYQDSPLLKSLLMHDLWVL